MKLRKIIDKMILYQLGTTPRGIRVCDPHSFYITDEDCETIRDALALVGMLAEAEPSKEEMEKFRIVARDIDKCTP